MDGFILAISSSDAARNKQQWVTVFAKADEISAKLIGFSDRSQHQVRWSLNLVGAEICTPVPGEPNFGVLLDDAPYCFYVRETSASRDCTYFFSASDDATKKRWMKQLLQIAKDGPTAPRFAVTQAENEFAFCARVIKSRPHEQGSHAVGIHTHPAMVAECSLVADCCAGVFGDLHLQSLQQTYPATGRQGVVALAPVLRV